MGKKKISLTTLISLMMVTIVIGGVVGYYISQKSGLKNAVLEKNNSNLKGQSLIVGKEIGVFQTKEGVNANRNNQSTSALYPSNNVYTGNGNWVETNSSSQSALYPSNETISSSQSALYPSNETISSSQSALYPSNETNSSSQSVLYPSNGTNSTSTYSNEYGGNAIGYSTYEIVKNPASTELFLSEISKIGIQCEKNEGTSGVNEVYVGYSENQESSASLIRYDNSYDARAYYCMQRDRLIDLYRKQCSVVIESGPNWESTVIAIPEVEGYIYIEVVDNLLIAISTESAPIANEIDRISRNLGY